MVAPSLANAPPDIVLSIAEYIDLASLLHLRSTSRALNSVISPLALHNISIAIDKSKEHVKKTLQLSSELLPGIYQHAKHLTIKTHGWYVSRWVDRTQIANVYNMVGQLESLISLSIVWEAGHDDVYETTMFIHEIQEKVVEALLKATGGRLSALVIEPMRQMKGYLLGLPRALVDFRGLKSLAFIVNKYGCLSRYRLDRQHPTPCVPASQRDALRTLVHNNPQLEYLNIEQGCVIDTHDGGRLLAGDGQQLLALRALRVKGVDFPLPITTDPSPFSHLQELETLMPYSIYPLDNLWSSLKAAKTELTKLTTCQVSLPLVTYLATYSGLRELVITNIENRRECGSYESAKLFFTRALPRHSSSLTLLTISLDTDIDYLDGWSFIPSLWMPVLTNLYALRSLSLYPGNEKRFEPGTPEYRHVVGSTQSESDDEQDDQPQRIPDRRQTPITCNYQEVLNNVESLPSLEALYIIWPSNSYGLTLRQREWMTWSYWVLRAVARRLRSTNGTPKRLRLWVGTYESWKRENSAYWRYVLREVERHG